MAIEKHSAWIMDRGGKQRIQELTEIEWLEYGRVRDDISVARVQVNATKDSKQAEFLASLVGATGRYELCIWRGDDREWEGPLTLCAFQADGVLINARDVMHYTTRLWMESAYDNSYPNTIKGVQRALNILTTELTRKDDAELAVGLPSVNVLPYLTGHQTSTDADTSRNTVPYQFLVFEHIDDMAAKGGIDYTVVGRAIHLWDTSKPAMGYTRTVTEVDFLGELYVSAYGMELGTRSAVTDGQGRAGVVGGVDPYYGLVERLATAYDEDASAAPTDAELASQASRNLASRNPTPFQVRIPDNSTVNMEGVLDMSMLIPGIYMPMLATINLVEVSQMQKLQSVKVREDSDGETVQVVLFPASAADTPEVS